MNKTTPFYSSQDKQRIADKLDQLARRLVAEQRHIDPWCCGTTCVGRG